ncbi:MAG: hypothetical protein QF473_40675, partial [Planctomycetota bacterium]|nr:hypothetical protein [Planctomycetota bacterium]
KGLSPYQAKLIKSLVQSDHFADVLLDVKQQLIVQVLASNVSFDEYGGHDHYLTLAQDLKEKNLMAIITRNLKKDEEHPQLQIPTGVNLTRMTYRLSMFGKWFAAACVQPTVTASVPKQPK